MDKEVKDYLVEVKILYPLKATSEADAKKQVKGIVELCGFKEFILKIIRSARTREQQNASELFFTQLESHCAERGLTAQDMYKEPAEIPITRSMAKDFFRRVGKVSFGKESTSQLNTKQFSSVVDVCEREWGERLDFQNEFPNKDLLVYGKKK